MPRLLNWAKTSSFVASSGTSSASRCRAKRSSRSGVSVKRRIPEDAPLRRVPRQPTCPSAQSVVYSECNGADRIQTQTRLQKDRRAGRQARSKKGQRRVAIRHSKACCAPVALRLPLGNGRRAEIVGTAEGTSLEARRETSCCRSRGPSD